MATHLGYSGWFRKFVDPILSLHDQGLGPMAIKRALLASDLRVDDPWSGEAQTLVPTTQMIAYIIRREGDARKFRARQHEIALLRFRRRPSPGRVIDMGRHDELLARCELYRRLAQAQLAESA